MDNIFSSLKYLGFKNADSLELYSKKDEVCEKECKNNEIDINSLLYNKKATCPVCKKEFTYRTVKSYVPRVRSKDSDSFIRYEVINPYFYEVIVCPTCGYAALKSDFNKIRSNKKEVILMKVGNQWRGREYPEVYDEKIAIERYKLALLNAVVGELKDSTKAVLCLKIAWMYRMLDNDKNEVEFLNKAIQGFLIAYERERTPIYGLNIYSLQYLIGELFRRVGDYANAKLWLGRVIISGADQKLKDKARDMRDMAKEQEARINEIVEE